MVEIPLVILKDQPTQCHSKNPDFPSHQNTARDLNYIKLKPEEETPYPDPLLYLADILVDSYHFLTHPQFSENLPRDKKAEIIKKILEEKIRVIYETLNGKGISTAEFKKLAVGKLSESNSDFIRYLSDKYGVKIPLYKEGIRIIPLDSILRCVSAYAQGFVLTEARCIFLNFDSITTSVNYLTSKNGSSEKSLFRRIISTTCCHELIHLFSDLAFWRIKENYVPGKIGLRIIKPKREAGSFLFLDRGKELKEAVTAEIISRWIKDNNSNIDMQQIDENEEPYKDEREVLEELIKTIAYERKIGENEAFQYFAKALFSPSDFRRLVEILDGHEKTTDGKFITKRPHFTSILYFLMDWESRQIWKKAQEGEANLHYEITLGFIKGSLTDEQKQKIREALNLSASYALSLAARKILEEKIS